MISLAHRLHEIAFPLATGSVAPVLGDEESPRASASGFVLTRLGRKPAVASGFSCIDGRPGQPKSLLSCAGGALGLGIAAAWASGASSIEQVEGSISRALRALEDGGATLAAHDSDTRGADPSICGCGAVDEAHRAILFAAEHLDELRMLSGRCGHAIGAQSGESLARHSSVYPPEASGSTLWNKVVANEGSMALWTAQGSHAEQAVLINLVPDSLAEPSGAQDASQLFHCDLWAVSSATRVIAGHIGVDEALLADAAILFNLSVLHVLCSPRMPVLIIEGA